MSTFPNIGNADQQPSITSGGLLAAGFDAAWDHIEDVIAILRMVEDGAWTWAENSRCKYLNIRLDMRDGHCVIRDRNNERISLEQLKFQYSANTTNEGQR